MDITMYCAPWCGDCRRSETVLEQYGITFKKRDVDADPKALQEFLTLVGDGPHNIPQILFQHYENEDGKEGKTGEMVTDAILVEPSNQELISALQTYGFIPAAQSS